MRLAIFSGVRSALPALQAELDDVLYPIETEIGLLAKDGGEPPPQRPAREVVGVTALTPDEDRYPDDNR